MLKSYQLYALQEKEELFDNLKTREEGITSKEAEEKTAQYGKNEVNKTTVSPLRIFIRQFASSFIYLLAGAAVLSLILGETIDAIFIILFIGIGVVLGFWQEWKSEKAISLLQSYITNHTHVRRENSVVALPTSELVPGDILVLQAGDKIPADVRFLKTEGVQVDEAILTGESGSVTKSSESLSASPQSYYQAANIGFFGMLMVSGEAEAVVIATGKNTEAGEITQLSMSTETISPFHKQIEKISRAILYVTLITILFVFVLHFIVKGSAFKIGDFTIFAIALAVGVVPEALPLVITLSLSQGALRLARKKVVPKRLAAIEDLGSIDVLCTDKTGTITEDKLQVEDIIGEKEVLFFQGSFASSFLGGGQKEPTATMDRVLWDLLNKKEKEEIQKIKRIKEFPFDQVRRRSSVLIQQGTHTTLVVRGTADEMLPFCQTSMISGKSEPLTPKKQEELLAWITQKESEGKRVIAVAVRKLESKTQAITKKDEESSLTLLGCISFMDPLKKTAEGAIRNAKLLGITVKILTGDSREVAGFNAKEIGLIKDVHQVILGVEFEKLSHKEKLQTVETCHVFARMSPTQKYEVIEHLKEKHLVGYLGEGFNDAPALKLAHVGLAVENASDIAKDAADIILLNKSLSVITSGIEEGRRTFANSVKYVKATLAANFGNFYALAFSSLTISFLPMLPLQILLVNLLTDVPHISIATDAVDVADLHRPHAVNMREILFLATVLGLVSTVFDFAFFGYFVHSGEKTLQTMWFMGSVLTELVFLFSIRTVKPFFKATRPSMTIIVLTLVAYTITMILPYTEIGRRAFSLIAPSSAQLIPMFLLVGFYFISTEGAKLLFYHFQKPQK